MDAFVGWLMIGAALWLSWPGFRTPGQRVLLVALVLLVPLVSWVWTIRKGVLARRAARQDERLQQFRRLSVQRARDLEFWRWARECGTEQERQLARGMLDLLSTPAETGPTYLPPKMWGRLHT